MSINVLVSTMHQNSKELLKNMNISTSAVIINQNDSLPNRKEVLSYQDSNITWIDIKGRGLSKSRNIALKNSNSDISVIADDDLIYVNNYAEIINKAYLDFPDADIICFQIEGIDGTFKTYEDEYKKLNFFSALKKSSVEITFKTESIKKHGIHFDENFGAGSQYFMGEENIFLSECLKNGLTIYYVPKKIADLYIGESTWFNGYTKNFFISRGASFYGMSKKLSTFLIVQWGLRKYKEYSSEMSLYNAIKYMFQGKKEIKALRSNL